MAKRLHVVKPEPVPQRYVSVGDVGAYCGKSESWGRNLIRQMRTHPKFHRGVLPQNGSSVLVVIPVLNEFIEWRSENFLRG